MIHDFHEDYRRFAVEFGNMRAEDQTRLLAMLDDEYPDHQDEQDEQVDSGGVCA